MHRAAFAIAALPLCLPVAPASAAGGTVSVSYSVHTINTGSSDVIVAYCEATATPAPGSGDVATHTTVTCSVDGAGVTLTKPGGKAVAVIGSMPREAHTFCYSARAGFLNSDLSGSYFAHAPLTCLAV